MSPLTREQFQSFLEGATGLQVSYWLRPKLTSRREPDLVAQAGRYTFVVESVASARAAPVSQAARRVKQLSERLGKNAVPLVLVPFMGAAGAQICRECGVGYLDRAGNAHVEAEGLRAHVEGRPNRFVPRGRPSSPFAPMSSRVARVLLQGPARWHLQKELARESGLGPGYVSRIVRRLAEDGLLERNEAGAVRPADPGLLLDAWSEDYDFGKHEVIAGELPARDVRELLRRLTRGLARAGVECAVTGPAAARRLRRGSGGEGPAHGRGSRTDGQGERSLGLGLVPVYVASTLDELPLERLGFRQGQSGANVSLVIPKDSGVFYGSSEVEGIRCVSPVQAYLDLKAVPGWSEEAERFRRRLFGVAGR